MNGLTFSSKKSLNAVLYGLYLELGVQYRVDHKILNRFHKLRITLCLEFKTAYNYPIMQRSGKI